MARKKRKNRCVEAGARNNKKDLESIHQAIEAMFATLTAEQLKAVYDRLRAKYDEANSKR